MSKFAVNAFTDCYGDVEPITIISYDGDKYAKIIRSNGEEDEIKSGYCYKNAVTYNNHPKRFSRVIWWMLEGKNKKDYKPRAPVLKLFKNHWYILEDSNHIIYTNLQDAAKAAFNCANKLSEEAEICSNNLLTSVFVDSDGRVVEYNWRQSNMRNRVSKMAHGKFKKNLSRMLGYKD